MSYPSPCDTCESPCGGGSGCEKWKIRYRYRQKQINAFAKKILRPEMRIRKQKVFAYDHPDDVRRYLRTNPCKGCQLEADCDIPCLVYLHWYDDHMAIARKRAGL
jgi:hypothetical protein